MDRDTLRQYLTFYQDLGIGSVYVRKMTKQSQFPPPATPTPAVEVALNQPLPGLAPENDTLARIAADIGDCKRCRLHEARHKIVFCDGAEQARLVFVGEGPGADEDMQGIPFVGRA